MSTNICPGCNSQLKFMNTPNFGGGKLSDGNRVCRSCFKTLAKQDVSFGLKSKKNYSSEMVVAIIQKGDLKHNIPDRPEILAMYIFENFIGLKKLLKLRSN